MVPQFTEEAYKEKIARIKNHLQNGDIYEINYCVEFLGASNDFQAEAFFMELSQKTVAPFSAFYKMDNKYLLCASPERYLADNANKDGIPPAMPELCRCNIQHFLLLVNSPDKSDGKKYRYFLPQCKTTHQSVHLEPFLPVGLVQ